jgi:hypothetical protein
LISAWNGVAAFRELLNPEGGEVREPANRQWSGTALRQLALNPTWSPARVCQYHRAATDSEARRLSERRAGVEHPVEAPIEALGRRPENKRGEDLSSRSLQRTASGRPSATRTQDGVP